jgi:hypothetical protein
MATGASTPAPRRSRKLLYAFCIVVLLGIMLIHKQQVLAEQARVNDLTAVNLGEVDLGSSVTRFVLASFRGPLICGMWWDAIEKQARHEFAEMELVIRALTKLQPYYTGPWQYQAWNLAYNVAVEFDAVADKFHYVCEGIRWLRDGERKNRVRLFSPEKQAVVEVGDPDMRQELGFYIQTKMTYADENLVYRCLLHMACMNPANRDAQKLANDPQLLREFKAANPQLVRRIKDLRYVPDGAEDILDRELWAFLREYEDIPSIFPKPGETVLTKEFPVWPDSANPAAARPSNPELEEYQNPYDIGRAWFEFSQEPLPPLNPESGDPFPVANKWQRRNKKQHSLIFRSHPARARAHQARDYNKTGWQTPGQEAWRQAFDRWILFGKQSGLEVPEAKMRELQMAYSYFVQQLPEQAARNEAPTPDLKTRFSPEDWKRVLDGYKAGTTLSRIQNLRSFPRYDYWRTVAEAGSTDDYRVAREYWYQGQRFKSDLARARAAFDKSMGPWDRVLRRDLELPEYVNFCARLSLLCTDGVPAALALQPLRIRQPSNFGHDTSVQEELAEFDEEYLVIQAQQEAPAWLAALYAGLTLNGNGVGHALVSPAQVAGASYSVMAFSARELKISRVEDMIQRFDGPFASYISPEIRLGRESKDRKGELRSGRRQMLSPFDTTDRETMGENKP